jgi:hypothetical protein
MKTGQCLCGEVRYQVKGDIKYVAACHCRMCQRQSGGAFQLWAMCRAEDLQLISGRPKEFNSSKNVGRGSCPKCSSHLYFRYLDNTKAIFIAATSLDDVDLRPNSHIWVGSKLSWLCLQDGIEQKLAE